jgi:NADH-quinone oxidoreductase subunit C
VAAQVGASAWSADHGTAKLTVDRAGWHQAVAAARDEAGLDFFSWLSAIDWSSEVAVGDPVEDPEALDERYEVLCGLSTLADGRLVILSTDLPKDDATITSITDLFEGAAWHEREAYEMFGIDFAGHPRLVRLYLPDAFEGHPLRKSFPLLSREVKPWPGLVDVEDMPSTENPEAAATEPAATDSGGEGGAA